MLKNYDLKQPDNTWQRFNGSDDRYIYPASGDVSYNKRNAYVLANNSEGWGAIGNITVNTEPVKDLRIMAAYTYTESKEISGMPGSNAASAYNGLLEINGPHLPDLQRSQYVVPSKAIASVSYRIPWWSNSFKSSTTINLFYSGYTSGRFSYAYSNDMNGDGYATDLLYIPAAKGDIKFISTADEDAFFNFMEQDSYLKSHKGEYAEANTVLAPWVHNFDFRIAREYYIKVGGSTNTLQLSMDFLNVGNLLNSEWGVNQNMFSSNNGRILKYEGKDASNVPSYSMVKVKDTAGNSVYPTESFIPLSTYTQCWRLQVGVRYFF